MAIDGSWVLTGTQKGKCSTALQTEVFSYLEKNSKCLNLVEINRRKQHNGQGETGLSTN